MDLGPISKRDLYGEALGHIAEKMNLIGGTRVGWEDKQKYRDHLIEMVTKGYITEDEYEARMEWVETAQTDTLLQVALTDLPRIPLTPRPNLKQKRRPVHEWLGSPYWMGSLAVYEFVIFLLGVFGGHLSTILIGGICCILFTILTVKRIKDEVERDS